MMHVRINIPRVAEDVLRQEWGDLDQAATEALLIESYWTGKISIGFLAEPPTPLNELSGPMFEAFKASGMTGGELGDLLEKAKHEMRAEHRAKQRP